MIVKKKIISDKELYYIGIAEGNNIVYYDESRQTIIVPYCYLTLDSIEEFGLKFEDIKEHGEI